MLYSSVNCNEFDSYLQKLLIRNQKCDNMDNNVNANRDMIPMSQPCFTGDTIRDNVDGHQIMVDVCSSDKLLINCPFKYDYSTI